MLQELITTIKNITKFGLHPNLAVENREAILEKDLVKIYCLYFQAEFEADNFDYPDFTSVNYSGIRSNVCSNFPEFGLYKTHLDVYDIDNLQDSAIGDAIDDLTDIIKDLLEISWRLENNSTADGLWFFRFIFLSHTRQHLLDLLNYIKNGER